MKTISLTKVMLFLVSFATVLVSAAQADPRTHKAGVLDQNPKEKFVIVTGSNIPQKVELKSIGTTTPYNLRMYTRRELQSTGRSTPAGALAALDPSIFISGR